MRLLSGILDLILYTSIFTACCATGLCMATEKLVLGGFPPLLDHLHIFVFGSSLLVYNAPRVLRKPFAGERNPASLLVNYRLWYFVCFIAGACMCIASLFLLPYRLLPGCMALGICALTYSLPLLPFRKKRRLREYGWLKIMVLASVWTIVTSILPILALGKAVTDYPFEILLRLMFIFTLCIIFDMRDVEQDFKNNINTLPRKLGLRNSYRLIDTTLLLFVLVSVVQYVRVHSLERLAGALITAIVTRLVVGYLKKHPTDRAYMGLADGVMLFYTILVLIPRL